MAKHGVLVDLELAVRRHQPAVAGEREWIDLDGQRIVGPAERVELGDQRRELRLQGAEPGAEDKVADLEGERAAPWIRMELRDRFRMRLGDLFDLHPALGAQDHDGLAGVAVQCQTEVQLAQDLLRRLAPDLPHAIALDRHSQDFASRALGIQRRPGQLDSTSLPPAADGNLRLHYHRAERAGRERGLVRTLRQPSIGDRDAGGPEPLFHLVLEKFQRGMFP